jgi:hypothetical protein
LATRTRQSGYDVRVLPCRHVCTGAARVQPIISSFQVMVRGKWAAALNTWFDRARASRVASFANGLPQRHARHQRRNRLCLVKRPQPKAGSPI